VDRGCRPELCAKEGEEHDLWRGWGKREDCGGDSGRLGEKWDVFLEGV